MGWTTWTWTTWRIFSVLDIQDHFERNMKHLLINHQSKYYVKTQKRITFKIKTGYIIELLTSATLKLLSSTERKITKDKNAENAPQLEIAEVVLVNKS